MTDQNKVVDHFELGNIAMQDNRLDAAIAEFKEALKSNAEFAEAYNNMGLALFNQSRFDEAIEEFRNALRIEPDFSLAHANLGLVMLNKELVDEAIEELTRAVSLNPEITEAYYNLGIAYNRKGLVDETIKAYEGFIQHAGENYRNYVEGVQKIVSQLKRKANAPISSEL
jgi:tetratricopeptide (TPR) repeat protein